MLGEAEIGPAHPGDDELRVAVAKLTDRSEDVDGETVLLAGGDWGNGE